MRNSLHKKPTYLLLTILFFLASFSFFTLVANAAIADDLKRGLALPVRVEALYGIPEIPDDLDFGDRTKVLDNIMSDTVVVSAINTVLTTSIDREAALGKYDGMVAFKSGGLCTASTISNTSSPCDTPGRLSTLRADSEVIFFEKAFSKADTASNAAIEALRLALIRARNNQEVTIAGMIPTGQSTKLLNSRTTLLSESQTGASSVISDTSNVDVTQQSTGHRPNQANIDAAIEYNNALAKFLADEQAGTSGAIDSSTAGGASTLKNAGSFTVGTIYTIKSVGSTDFTLIGASNNAVGTVFTATGRGSGTGTASTGAGGAVAGAGAAALGGYNKDKDALAVQMHTACSIWEGNIMPCVAEFVYYVVYKPASFLLAGSGLIFDYILMLSIDNSKNMVAPPFIDTAWTVVRDFSNMLFIFVLLYTGIMTMFGMADWKKVVIKVVVIALLINFSLFFTKVVIDAGNVLAVGIKSAIGNESISAGLVDSFKPQRFLSAAVNSDKGNDEGLNAIIVFIIAAIVSGFAAFYIFKAALLFFGRLIGFWFLMIVSPFVFVSAALPAGDKLKTWFGSLIGLTFVAPAFLFLIYLLTMIISSGGGILSYFNQTGLGWFNSILGPVMVATLIILALKEILKITEKMAGDFGELGANALSVAMTGAGVMSGIGGIVARQTLGRAAAANLRDNPAKTSEELAKMSWGERKAYETQRGLMTSMSRSSFDVRNIGDKNSLISKTLSGKVFQADQGIGGREKIAKEEIKSAKEAVEKGKVGIFEEQGIRNSAALKVAGLEADVVAKEAEAKAATELVNQIKIAQETAEKEHAESPEAKAMNEAKKAYDLAVSDRQRPGGGSEEAVDKTKAAFDEAKKNHETSASALKLADSISGLTKAQKEEAEAISNLAAAKSKAKESNPDKIAKEIIDTENKARKTRAIDEIENSGSILGIDMTKFGYAANRNVIASNLREKKETSADVLKKASKLYAEEVKAEEEAKGGEEKPADKKDH